MSAEDVNDFLASACQQCGAACCKMGKIFLPPVEHERIRRHVAALGAEAEAEFAERTTDHGYFFLYDQRNRCQFLDERNLCRLHNLGLKPSECFWWPYHVFPGEGPSGLELRVFTGCCDGHKADHPDSPYHQLIESQAAKFGFDVIRKFREVYAGGKGTTRFIKALREPVAPDEPGEHSGVPNKATPA